MAWDRSDRAARLPRDWKARKRAVWRRDGDICHWCGTPGADVIDHVTPGDNHRLDNLAPIHQDVWPECHKQKTAGEALEVRHRKRDSRRRAPEAHPLDTKGPSCA